VTVARVKIVLREPVPKLGETGDVVTVSGGYARNFLIPRGLAVAATKGNVKQAETWAASRSARDAKTLAEATALKARLEAQPLRLSANAGPDGRLFGSITTAQVADGIASDLGVDVDRHAVELAEPIRHLGMHEVRVNLPADVIATVTVEAVEATG
jgi:large subunit ribosomal protein L9